MQLKKSKCFPFCELVISRRALGREGDYKMHPVCACMCALVCHAGFSKTATATDFLSINCPNEFLCL